MKRTRVIIMGAAGRDFHNFNVCFREKPDYEVIAFTAAQIPFIADRIYPPSLAGDLYPLGIPILDESELPSLIRKHCVNLVVFAYSDISHEVLMHKASLALAEGADFTFLGPRSTMLSSVKPVISVCAVRTGAGKSQMTRYLCDLLEQKGIRPVVVRHPMPYGNLVEQEILRFASSSDLSLQGCTVEEREEFEPLLKRGITVYAGIDYLKVFKAAEREGDMVVWDGGNNDIPFLKSDLEITLVDPLRPGHETTFYPGEVNLRRAQIIVINKANSATGDVVEKLQGRLTKINPGAAQVVTDSIIKVDDPNAIAGKRVLVVEDGPTITHGGMPHGAGMAAAGLYAAGEVVDPRPYAVGSIADAFRKYPHIGAVLPAVGYSKNQIEDLQETIGRIACDIVVSATPVDLAGFMEIDKPIVHVTYEIREREGNRFDDIISRFVESHFSRS